MARSNAATAVRETPGKIPARAYQTALRRAAGASAASADRIFEFVFSDGTVDRMGDTIDPDGWDIEAYEKNPVVLYAHDNYSVPIAKCVKLWVEGGALRGQIQVSTDARGEEVFQKLLAGELNAVSVGFQPKRWEYVEDDERRGMDFKEQELLEVSVVPVPANANALIQPRTRSMPKTATKADDGVGELNETHEKLNALMDRHEKCVKALEEHEKRMGEHVKALGEHVEKIASLYGADAVSDGDAAKEGADGKAVIEALVKAGMSLDDATARVKAIKASASHVLSDTQYQRCFGAHKSLSKMLADHHEGMGAAPAGTEPGGKPDNDADGSGEDEPDEDDKKQMAELERKTAELAELTTQLTGKV